MPSAIRRVGGLARRALVAVSPVAQSQALPLGATLGLLLAGAWLEQVAVLNHDAGWLLVGTRRLLAGARLYVDGFVDVNPPGFLYWLTPAVAASQWSGVPETRAYPAYLWLWSAASLWLCDRLLRAQLGAEQALTRRWYTAILAFVLFVWPATSFHAMPVHSLGQREHLVVVALTALVPLAALRRRRRTVAPALAGAAGALAGIALWAKPQYLLVVAALELWWRARSRALRPLATPELLTLAGVSAAYLASLVLFTPAYLETVLPLAADTYWAYQRPAMALVAPGDLAALAAAALAAFATRRVEGVGEPCAGFAIAAASAWLAFLLGGTDWPYHALPFRSFALAGVACAAFAWTARAPAEALARPRAAAVFTAAAGLAALAVGVLPWNIGHTLRDSEAWKALTVGIWQDVLDRHAPKGPLLAFSSALPPAFPLVNYANVEWSSRYSCQWMLPALARARAGKSARALSPERIAAIERTVIDAVVADLESTPPALVLVDVRPHKPAFAGVPFDFVAFFSRDARFRRIWSGYRRAGTLAGFDYYVRDGADATAEVTTGARAPAARTAPAPAPTAPRRR